MSACYAKSNRCLGKIELGNRSSPGFLAVVLGILLQSLFRSFRIPKFEQTNGGARRALSRTSEILFSPLQKYGQATSLERGPSASSIDPIRFQNICQYEIQIHLFIFYDCYKTAVRDPFVSIPLRLLNSPWFVLNLSKQRSLPSIDPIRFQKRLQLAFAQIYTPSD